ncbi:MAG: GAF domain-containing protein [Chloroflexi bacterium]|nr:GAF domain-containing protein [Chloroflexota bacterium]
MPRPPELSVGQRLGLGFGLIVLLLLGQTGFSILQARRSEAITDHLVKVLNPRESLSRDFELAYLNQAIALRSLAITDEPNAEQDYQEASRRGFVALAELERQAESPDERALVAELRPLANRYRGASETFLNRVRSAAGDAALADAERAIDSLREEIAGRADALIAVQQAMQVTARTDIERARDLTLWSQLLVGVLVSLVALIAGLVATQAVRVPARQLAVAARALGAGDHRPALALAEDIPSRSLEDGSRHRDELRDLAQTFRRMAAQLLQREQRLTAQGRLSAVLASTLEVEPLVSGALDEVLSHTGCELGAVYVHDRLAASLIPLVAAGMSGTLGPLGAGVGLPGQALARRRPVVVRELPSDAPYRLHLGFEQVPARGAAALPMLLGEEVVGVLLLASVRELPSDALAFAESVAPQVGISLRHALVHRQVTRLAVELEEKNTDLQAQAERILVQAEEIQAQNEALQAQTEELQTQTEEIQAQNEEIQTQNEELKAQQHALIEADRLKEEFLSVAVHELRSPVAGIKGAAQLLRRQAARQPALAAIDGRLAAIDDQSNKLVTRINRLLDVTRARMGRLQLQKDAVDLVRLARGRTTEWQRRAANHRVHLETAEEQLVGSWDRGYLEQVLDNLLENAVRYSPDGGEIEVALRQEGDWAVLSVTDSGIGIPTEFMPHLFQLYFRHDGAREVSAEGLGLGLYITREIVAAHGGQIEAQSASGRTTFTVRLPPETASVESLVS